MTSSTAVGPSPLLSKPSTLAPALKSKEARMGIAHALAHATFRGIDAVRTTNPFAKQIAAMPRALVPARDNRA